GTIPLDALIVSQSTNHPIGYPKNAGHCPKKCTDFQKSRRCEESGRSLLCDPSNPTLAPASLPGLFPCWPLVNRWVALRKLRFLERTVLCHGSASASPW